MRYIFKRIETVEDFLKEIGRTDIPSTDVVIRRPAIDEVTGEVVADFEIDFGAYSLPPADRDKLNSLMARMRMKPI